MRGEAALRRGPLAGALTAVVTGGVMSLLVTIAGRELSGFTAAILALTIPLIGAGVLFGWLMETQRLPSFGRAMAYWGVAFSASRVIQQFLVGDRHPKDGLVGFVIYQAIVGMLFGLGFLLLYQQTLAGFRRVLGEPAAPEVDGDTGTAD
jgi:drug/metabolite transporter superfamily protein YnfA